jgi:hypothetical protein
MIPIPARIAASIDKIAGPRKRSAFVVEALGREIRRREQLEALEQAVGAWKDEDHPELASGADTWVRELRDASAERLEKIGRDESAG